MNDQDFPVAGALFEDRPPPDLSRPMSRATVLRQLVGGGAAAVGAAAATGLAMMPSATAAPSRTQDQKILNYLLVLEHLQDAFYRSVRSGSTLSGESRKYALLVGRQERAHVQLLTKMLGAAAQPAPRFHFPASAKTGNGFAKTALELEEAAVGAYIATGPNLTQKAMAAVGSICAVEARHAAWIRSIADELPAPAAADPARTQQSVLATIRRFAK
ncbi:MAG: ferritin-like domain-containing protein [Gaiellaceae bacterium]